MTPLQKSYMLRASEEELAAWRAAAESDARPLAQWIRLQLNRATKLPQEPVTPSGMGSS